jgi:hypothetical protein
VRPEFPHESTLAGVHVVVECCTRCNGGVQDRDLVVLNHHVGGVVDGGWKEIRKQFETPHHAPPPLPIDGADLPRGRDRSLLAKGFDGAGVQFTDVEVEDAKTVEPRWGTGGRTRLMRKAVVFADKSGGRRDAWPYQPSGLRMRPGDRLPFLRGFAHAERPGVSVVLSDKEEDLGARPADRRTARYGRYLTSRGRHAPGRAGQVPAARGSSRDGAHDPARSGEHRDRVTGHRPVFTAGRCSG